MKNNFHAFDIMYFWLEQASKHIPNLFLNSQIYVLLYSIVLCNSKTFPISPQTHQCQIETTFMPKFSSLKPNLDPLLSLWTLNLASLVIGLGVPLVFAPILLVEECCKLAHEQGRLQSCSGVGHLRNLNPSLELL